MTVVARRLPVLGSVNAGKAATLASMGAELDRVRAVVWARFADAKTAQLSKRQIRDRLMAEDAPAGFGVPQRLWRATAEDTVDKIRAWQCAVIATEVRPKIYAHAGGEKTRGCRATSEKPLPVSGRGPAGRGASWPTTAPTTCNVTTRAGCGWRS